MTILSLYPNPTNSFLAIKSELVIEKIVIYDLLSKVLIINEPNKTEANLDIHDLPTGIYLIKIQSGGVEYLRKVEKY